MDIFIGRDGQRVGLVSRATEAELKTSYMVYRLVDANNVPENGYYVCSARFWVKCFIPEKVAGTVKPEWKGY